MADETHHQAVPPEPFEGEGVSASSPTEQAFRACLQAVDPHPNDEALTYAQVLGRLQTVLTRELQQAGG